MPLSNPLLYTKITYGQRTSTVIRVAFHSLPYKAKLLLPRVLSHVHAMSLFPRQDNFEICNRDRHCLSLQCFGCLSHDSSETLLFCSVLDIRKLTSASSYFSHLAGGLIIGLFTYFLNCFSRHRSIFRTPFHLLFIIQISRTDHSPRQWSTSHPNSPLSNPRVSESHPPHYHLRVR